MATRLEFLEDAYRTEVEARIVSRNGDRLVLDRSVFYPGIGVSPPDRGEILLPGGRKVAVNCSKWHDQHPFVLEHLCNELPTDIEEEMQVVAKIHWMPRFASMRVHTALHLVSIALPYPMIDGAIHLTEGSAIFEVDETGLGVKDLEGVVNDLVLRDLPVEAISVLPPIYDRSIGARSFHWPGSNGHARAIEIGDVDQQLCDGLHVRGTLEIGRVEITELRKLQDRRYRCDLRVHGQV